MSEATSISVLHVDDEPNFAELVSDMLEREDDRFAVETATSASEGLNRLAADDFDSIISDYEMPGKNGIEFLEQVREEYPDLPFILYTGKGSEEVASDALKAGATDYIQKQSGSEQYKLLANCMQNAVEQYRSERRLREMRQEYATIFESAQHGLVLVNISDDEFHYLRCNPRAIELLGRDRTEIIGESPFKVLDSENAEKIVGIYRKCIDQCEPVECHLTPDLPAGQAIWECLVSPVTSNGEVEQLAVTFHDITEHEHHKKELNRQNERLEEFASVVSHDLRNLLQVGNGRVELLQGEVESEYIDDISRTLDRMDELIENLLTLAREGDQIGELELVEFPDCVEDCLQCSVE